MNFGVFVVIYSYKKQIVEIVFEHCRIAFFFDLFYCRVGILIPFEFDNYCRIFFVKRNECDVGKTFAGRKLLNDRIFRTSRVIR